MDGPILCGRCGYTNLEDARYCVICGAKLEGELVPPLDPPVGDVPCSKCGSLNEAIAAHCRFCGKKMKAAGKKTLPEPIGTPPAEVPAEHPQGEPVSRDFGELDQEVDPEEMRVLFGFDEESPQPDASSETVEEALPTMDDLEAELHELNEQTERSETEEEPEPEAPSLLSDPGGMITDPDEMAKLIALIKADEPTPTEAPPVAPSPELAASPSDPGGMITDPDEMAKLIASIKSDEAEPVSGESVEAGEAPEETVPESLVATDEERVVTPYESVAANPRDLAEETPTLPDPVEEEPKKPYKRDDIPPDIPPVFPPRTRGAFRKKIRARAAAVLFPLFAVATFFVCGLSIGLWTSYFFL